MLLLELKGLSFEVSSDLQGQPLGTNKLRLRMLHSLIPLPNLRSNTGGTFITPNMGL